MGNTRHHNKKLSEKEQEQLQLFLNHYFPSSHASANDRPTPKTTPRRINIRYKGFDALTFADVELLSHIPAHPFWSRVEELIDFSFADTLCAPLYSPLGQRPYAPSLKLKIHLMQRYYGWSDRDMEMNMIYNMAVKRFLRVPFNFKGLDHSTVALDRDRLGSALFDACHHVILAQARALGLWGDQEDKWFADAFHTYAHAQKRSSYRLIQQAVLRILQHLKRTNKELFHWLIKQFPEEGWTRKRTGDDLAYSKLVASCYSLLHWLEHGPLHDLFWSWEDKVQQRRSLELQAILCQFLMQNTRQVEGPATTDRTYESIPRKERPADRMVSAVDPELRMGHKTVNKTFQGDKFQVIESSANKIVLDMEPVAGNAHDGECLIEMVDRITELHGTTPKEVVGDSAYGTGQNRLAMEERQIQLTAPLRSLGNPTGLFTSRHFAYDAQNQSVTCPNKQTTTRRVRNNALKGFQYKFDTKACQACHLRAQCTKGKHRTYFVSDYEEQHRRAAAHNETPEGKASLQARSEIERLNHELKNIIGMKHMWERSREKRRIQGKLAAMVMNIRTIVKTCCPSVEPLRRRVVLSCR